MSGRTLEVPDILLPDIRGLLTDTRKSGLTKYRVGALSIFCYPLAADLDSGKTARLRNRNGKRKKPSKVSVSRAMPSGRTSLLMSVS